MPVAHPALWILSAVLVLSSLGVILARKPVYASLSFLLTLLSLATVYLQLSAQFVAVMQVLVYAGAILVIFMFVMILFQDAHEQITLHAAQSYRPLLLLAATSFTLALVFVGAHLIGFDPFTDDPPQGYGTVQQLGEALYIDYFFPFEAVTLLFLIALVGSLYIAKKER